jgi:hypothetical protein
MASPLHQLTDFYLTVDCRSAGCRGERSFAISELARFYKDRTVATCAKCGAPIAVAVESWPHGWTGAQRPCEGWTLTSS